MPGPLVDLVMAARPNFMKIAPLYHELKRRGKVTPRLIHTGQHYDPLMSDQVLADLGVTAPDVHLGIGSGTHAEQTGRTMVAYEALLVKERAALTVVAGDVNATAACSLAAAKLGVPVAHLEAGLRSGDRGMPEEINRVVTDAIADVLWTPSPDADEHLAREGVPPDKVTRVGNIMMDAYEMIRPDIERQQTRNEFGLPARGYGVVTLHRPQNVDTAAGLTATLDALAATAPQIPLVFPVHPRTRKNLERHGLLERAQGIDGLHLTEPKPYLPFMSLVGDARLAITDSGGIQEETTYLGIPCITVRPNTERPITVTEGTNRLARPDEVPGLVTRILAGDWPTGRVPELWDGKTAGRVADDLERRLGL